MNTDKTLADVQPGGMVRLGDQALSTSEGARRYVADFFATELRRHDFRNYITTRLAADFACALAQYLASLPSPTDEHPDIASWSKGYHSGYARALADHAARQPVGEPVGRVRTRVDGGFIAELLPGVADRVSNMAPLYLQSPAPAVDPGKYRHSLLRASEWARRSDITSHAEDAGLLRELLALIDGKAVGNG